MSHFPPKHLQTRIVSVELELHVHGAVVWMKMLLVWMFGLQLVELFGKD